MENSPNNDKDIISDATWWRWPLIPLACFVGSSLGAVFMGLIQWFGMKFSGGFSEEGWCFIYILPIITSAVFGYLWVQISYYVAPKNKKITTVFMTVLLVAILLVVTAFSLLDLNNGTSEKVQSVLGGIAIIVAAVYTIMDLQEK